LAELGELGKDVLLRGLLTQVAHNDVRFGVLGKVTLTVKDDLLVLDHRVVHCRKAALQLGVFKKGDISVAEGLGLSGVASYGGGLDLKAMTLKELLHVQIKETLLGQVAYVERGPLSAVGPEVRLDLAGGLALLLRLYHVGELLQLLVGAAVS
jgi:hypothetical protein